MRIAIITGASSGLGREFAKQIAEKYASEIDEMWLIARRRQPLEELAAFLNDASDTGLQHPDGQTQSKNDTNQFRSTGQTQSENYTDRNRPDGQTQSENDADRTAKMEAVALPLDITKPEDIARLEQRLKRPETVVNYLVNAAGIAKIGGPFSIERSDLLSMIDLNCKAAVNLTALCLPYFRAKSHVLQICSTAAFQPMQGFNVYAASKAFLLRYSIALSWELLGKHIHVTAVCPYWVKGTEFISTAKDTGNEKGARAIRHFPFAFRPAIVVKWALVDNRIGWWVSTPGPVCIAHQIFCKFSPTAAALGAWEIFRRL